MWTAERKSESSGDWRGGEEERRRGGEDGGRGSGCGSGQDDELRDRIVAIFGRRVLFFKPTANTRVIPAPLDCRPYNLNFIAY